MQKQEKKGESMKKGIIAALACVFALSLALVGCSGGTSANDKAAWVGTWDLYEMDDNGTVTSSDDIELLRSLGLDVYLELNEDGTSSLVLFGEAAEGTWEAKSATEATITISGEQINLTIQDEKIKMTQNDQTLVFAKGEPRTSDASASADASSASSASSAS